MMALPTADIHVTEFAETLSHPVGVYRSGFRRDAGDGSTDSTTAQSLLVRLRHSRRQEPARLLDEMFGRECDTEIEAPHAIRSVA